MKAYLALYTIVYIAVMLYSSFSTYCLPAALGSETKFAPVKADMNTVSATPMCRWKTLPFFLLLIFKYTHNSGYFFYLPLYAHNDVHCLLSLTNNQKEIPRLTTEV